jgi:iron complex outermembrane receptor protein
MLGLTPSLQLQAGARYSWQHNRETGSIQAGPVTIPTTGSFQTRVPTGKLALNWTPVDGQFLYAFVARGFKSGGVNNAVSTFGSETNNDYEIG